MNKEQRSPEQIEKFEKFRDETIRRLARGESEASVFRDKPEGYTEWAKQHFKETGGIRLPKAESIPLYECWNCGKVYSGTRCPYCKAFKPK